MKTLVTNRLILREMSLDDVEDFYAYAKKPHIGPMAGWAPHESLHYSYEILKVMIKDNETWAITVKPHHHMVGTICLHVRNFENALANQKEIGYAIDDLYWGKGYMAEAVSKVLEYAFDTLELTKVLCGHATNNLQSKRVIEKSGFTWTHQETREHYDKSQIIINMYEMTKEKYKELYHDKSTNKI